MRKRDLLFSRMVRISSMFLTLFPFSVKARVSAGSERTQAVISASKDKCLRDDSQAISHEMQAQRELAVRVFGGAETTGALHSASDAGSALIHFELADSLIYMQASINGSMPLWMMLDTDPSVTVFDESVSKTLARARGHSKMGIRQSHYPHVWGKRSGRSNCGDSASGMVLAPSGPTHGWILRLQCIPQLCR